MKNFFKKIKEIFTNEKVIRSIVCVGLVIVIILIVGDARIDEEHLDKIRKYQIPREEELDAMEKEEIYGDKDVSENEILRGSLVRIGRIGRFVLVYDESTYDVYMTSDLGSICPYYDENGVPYKYDKNNKKLVDN